MKNVLLIALAVLLATQLASAQIGGWNPKAEEKAQATISAFKEKNSNLQTFFEEAYAYVVFPSIGKGAVGIGGAHGAGVAYEGHEAVGRAKMTQVTIGFQFGGQSYSEVIFFESQRDFRRFKESKLELAAQASAVAVDLGASADVAYQDGVAVFTMTKGGLMYEASLGGQKFKFKPFKK